MISDRAVIDPGAYLAEEVEIGPFCVIERDVSIGRGTRIGSHVVVRSGTQIGRDNRIYSFASIGEDPQFAGYAGEPTRLEIGNANVIREYVTLNRGSTSDRGTGVTLIGNTSPTKLVFINLTKFRNHLIAEIPTAKSADVDAIGLCRAARNDEVRSDILQAHRPYPSQRMWSYATELMDQRESAEDCVVPHFDVTCQAGAVGKDDVIS